MRLLYNFALVTFILSALLLAQEANPTRGAAPPFCSSDPRPEVKAFCDPLSRLQEFINSSPNGQDSRDLNQLDLSNPSANSKFIRVAAGRSAVEKLVAAVQQSASAAASGIAQAGQARLDRQLSATSNAAGTTSLVSKAGSSELLSFALDAGALTRSINGTTATLSTTADQLFRTITNYEPLCIATCSYKGRFETTVLVPLSIAVSFDLSQRSTTMINSAGQASGSPTTPVNTVSIPTGIGKLSVLTARYEIRNQFNARSPEFQKNWQSAISTQLTSLLLGASASGDAVRQILQRKARPLDRNALMDAARSDHTGSKLADAFAEYFNSESDQLLADEEVVSRVSQAVHDLGLYRDAWLEALHKAAGDLFTLEYTFSKPANQPQTHNFKLIYSHDFRAMGMLSFNGSASIYDAVPTGAKYGRVHSGQLSAQYDRNLRSDTAGFQPQLSLAGYYQYQPSPSILNIPTGTVAPGTNIPLPNGVQEFVGTAGSLWVTQAKVTIKGAGGISVPIAVSWANKTDLLQGTKVGAQVGINYDFAQLGGLLGRYH
jgi:hypothetical protein